MKIKDILKKFQKCRVSSGRSVEEVRQESPMPREEKVPVRQAAPAPSAPEEEAQSQVPMTKEDKIRAIENLLRMPDHAGSDFFHAFYDLMNRMDVLKFDYHAYITNYQKEIQQVSEADYDKCAAMLTAFYREDYWDNGSFARRCREGTVDAFLRRMVEVLKEEA